MTRRLSQLRDAIAKAVVDATIKDSVEADLQAACLSTGDKPTADGLVRLSA